MAAELAGKKRLTIGKVLYNSVMCVLFIAACICTGLMWISAHDSTNKIATQQNGDFDRRQQFEKKLIGHKVTGFKTLDTWIFPKEHGYVKWYEVTFDTGDALQFVVNNRGATRVFFETAAERAKPHVDVTEAMGFPNEREAAGAKPETKKSIPKPLGQGGRDG